MSTEKEKKIGKSKIDGNPEKGFIFRLRDGIIANRHLKDGAVSANKLSQDVETEWLDPKLEAKPYIKGISIKTDISEDTTVSDDVSLGEQKTIVYINNTQNEITITVPNSLYKTPDGNILHIIVPSGGYGEVSLLNIEGTIFARGC